MPEVCWRAACTVTGSFCGCSWPGISRMFWLKKVWPLVKPRTGSVPIANGTASQLSPGRHGSSGWEETEMPRTRGSVAPARSACESR